MKGIYTTKRKLSYNLQNLLSNQQLEYDVFTHMKSKQHYRDTYTFAVKQKTMSF